MLRPVKSLPPEDAQEAIREMIKNALERQNPGFKKLGERLREEIEARLRSEGVPEDTILYMRALQEVRARTRSSALARNLFQVQQLPPGALPIYDRDPDVASIVTASEDDEV